MAVQLRGIQALFLSLLAACSAAQEGGIASAGETALIGDLQWALATNGEDVEWSQAEEYCRALDLGGADDWRLPTLSELESLHDPGAGGGYAIAEPIQASTCCLWSSTSLVERPREEDDFYTGPSLDPEFYYWGFLYSIEGLRYYSVMGMPDGQALCVREPEDAPG